ncbi:MAG: biosynthetic-type acetolactate synthase large subunit [Thermodesulfobacteriota bacterium]
MKMSGAEIFVESLIQEEVTTIFGYPGGVITDIYDCLEKSPIRHYLVRHEQGAVHMADGFARASGKVGVCLVTSGPGATNTVTGIAAAFMDSIPIVVFTGQVPTPLIGNDAFQEVDIVGITRPCTKHNYLVKRVEDLARIIKEAFYLARSGRPGPILVDLPKDVLQNKTEFKYPKKVEMHSYRPTYSAHPGQIQKAAAQIVKAKKPVIYAGGGVVSSRSSPELKALAENMTIPVTTTLMGLGGFPGRHPLSLGMLGMHGTYWANMAVSQCDLLIAIGARFDDRVTGKIELFAPEARIIHIDIDPTSIRKNVSVDIPIVGDCRDALGKLNLALPKEEKPDWRKIRQPWLGQIKQWKDSHPLVYEQGKGEIKPQFVVEKIYEMTQGKAIISTEVGQNQMWAAQYYLFDRPNSFITSGGLGVMGFGFPAAIGAQVGCPDRLVIDIAGDGSIQMNIQEMATAVANQIPVKIAILNNGYLGMVRQFQELFYDKRYSQTFLKGNPDFVKLAEAYGAAGLRASKLEEVVPVIEKGLALKGPVIMDFVVCAEECVAPMVPAGKGMTEMLLV